MRLEKLLYDVYTNKNINAKIVQISDIHFSLDYKLARLKKIKDNIDKINPDYVCIVGDLIDDYNAVEMGKIEYFKGWLKELSVNYKTIISLGNHDFIVKRGNKYKEQSNIRWLLDIQNDNLIVLNNKIYSDDNINFVGYNPNYAYYYDRHEENDSIYNLELSSLLKNLKGYSILLLHTPSMITIKDNYKKINGIDKIDLVLCGHTHGGLMPSFFPGRFGIISPYKNLFPKCVRGRITYTNFDLIISSGIVKLSRKSNITKFNDLFSYNINVINIKKI